MEKHAHLASGLINFTAALIAISLSVYILIIGRSLLIPFMLAIVIWYMMTRFASLFSHIPIVGIKVPDGLAYLLAIITTGYIVYLFINLISSSIYGIIDQAPLYQAKIQQLLVMINQWAGSELDINKLLGKIDLPAFFSNLALTLTNVASNLGVIIIYVMFLSIEYKSFDDKVRAMTNSTAQLATSQAILEQVGNDINAYMRIKTGVSFITGVFSYTALAAFGIPYAQFWALLIFILNYIPTIGSIIAVGITLLAISIQFHSYVAFFTLTALLITIQFVVGNIVEPRLMGRNLNLSPLVILLSLAFWGSIWGVVGMFLCVPLMTILNIVLSRFESTRMIAVLLAADPNMITID